MKTYLFRRGRGSKLNVTVDVNGKPLCPRYDLHDHSPDGFNWSYCGSGPAQLALAICCDAFGVDAMALDLYQDFKREVLAAEKRDEFVMTDEAVKIWSLLRQVTPDQQATVMADLTQGEELRRTGYLETLNQVDTMLSMRGFEPDQVEGVLHPLFLLFEELNAELTFRTLAVVVGNLNLLDMADRKEQTI